MYRIGIIGLGVIYRQYIQALAYLKDLPKLVAVCDKNETALSDGLRMACKILGRDDIQGDANVLSFLDRKEMDVVVIATPPNTHFGLVMECLKADKKILVEKPALSSVDNFIEISTLRSDHSLLFQTAFHAAYAADLLWFIHHRQNIERQYALGQLMEITCNFSDPYVIHGQLLYGREVLGGSYLDSGVNELSVISRLTDINNLHVLEHNVCRLPDSEIVCQSQTVLKEFHSKIVVKLNTNWMLGKNEKTTLLIYDTGKAILLNHTAQTVTKIEGDRKTVLYVKREHPRLLIQYANLLKDYTRYLDNQVSNYNESLQIHHLLFEPISSPK